MSVVPATSGARSIKPAASVEVAGPTRRRRSRGLSAAIVAARGSGLGGGIHRAASIFLGMAIAVAACGGVVASPSGSGSPSSGGVHAGPSSSPSSAEPVIVTFRVGETEEFRVRLIDADDIANARVLLAGGAAPGIPNGRLVRGRSDVNAGHPWSLDPFDFTFADFTTEVCDGLPSAVDGASFSADRYCPWSAKVISIERPQAGDSQ